jgi:hypothetical protein
MGCYLDVVELVIFILSLAVQKETKQRLAMTYSGRPLQIVPCSWLKKELFVFAVR